jgi:acyl carrier protein phosphodiesterase
MAEDVKRQSKNNLLNDGNISIDNHTHFMEQAFIKTYPIMNVNAQQRKKLNKL